MATRKGLYKLATVSLLAGAFLCSNAFASNQFEKEAELETGAVKLVREVVKGEYNTITAKELKDLIATKKDILIIDTMPYKDSYAKEHIPGAKQFLFPIPDMVTWDSNETDGKTQEDYKALLGPDKEKQIIIYCGFVKCTRSHNGAIWAKKLGYTNVYRQPGGIFSWKGEGFETEKVE
jgi:thiosulfate/3-mercaptopyruvate sulfurtransferase